MANFNSIITATLALAIAFTISCSSNDSGSSNGGDPVGSTKDSCIRTELEIKANTLDEVAGACNATRGEVLAQLPSTIGNCNKNDLDFGKPLREILEACNVIEIPIVSSSSNGVSSSSVVGSSSSVGNSSSDTSSSGGSSSSVISTGYCAGFVVDSEREHYGKMKKQFCDERDGKKYVYVEIGTGATAQTWMAENLNRDAVGVQYDVCYATSPANCDTYGHLYEWETARTICPSGWHLPTRAEWNTLITKTASATGASRLMASSSSCPSCSDPYGFSALLGGRRATDRTGFDYIGTSGYWWSSEEVVPVTGDAHIINIDYNSEIIYYPERNKFFAYSVRCLKN